MSAPAQNRAASPAEDSPRSKVDSLTNKELVRRGQDQVREVKRLLRRGKKTIAQGSIEKIKGAMEAQSEALTAVKKLSDKQAGSKAHKQARETLLDCSDTLAELTDQHLSAYRKPAWRESLESIGLAVMVALALRSFIVEPFKIPSGSMIPTLAIGDQIFVNKYSYGIRVPFTSIRLVDFDLPERGQVVVFICPVPPNQDYIKRVIGLPGDVIEVKSGIIYVNGEAIKREYLGERTHVDRGEDDGPWYDFKAHAYQETLGDHVYTVLQESRPRVPDFGPAVVDEGHIFAMGDNRDHSYDSRAWGQVPAQNILGRALFVWLSIGRDGLAKERLGEWID